MDKLISKLARTDYNLNTLDNKLIIVSNNDFSIAVTPSIVNNHLMIVNLNKDPRSEMELFDLVRDGVPPIDIWPNVIYSPIHTGMEDDSAFKHICAYLK